MSERVFRSPYSELTPVRNAIFDRIMPALSSDAWKVLCVALRMTWGGDAVIDGDTLPGIGVTDFVEKTGIEDRTAVEAAIKECVDAGYLTFPESDDLVFDFVLNVDFTPDVAGPESQAAELMEATVSLPPALAPAFQALLDFARAMNAEPDLELVRRAVLDNGADAVGAWIEVGRVMTHLEPPARFQTVLERLLQGVPPLPLSMLEPEEPLDTVAVPGRESPAPADATPAPDVSGMSASELWQTTLQALRPKMRSSKYKFLAPTVGVALDGDTLTVAAANRRVRDWLETGQLAPLILETFRSIAGETMMLKFVVQEA